MTAATTRVGLPDRGHTSRRRRLWGLAFLVPPVALITVFTVAEGIGLEAGWWGHLLQLAVVVAVAVLAWVRPRLGGPLLILAGVVPAVWILSQAASGGSADSLPAIALVFLPLVVAGSLFTLAGNGRSREPTAVSPR